MKILLLFSHPDVIPTIHAAIFIFSGTTVETFLMIYAVFLPNNDSS